MSDLPPDFCPYKGLQPYTEEDRGFFFGRERDSDVIASNLYASSLTVLYGASGVGKSSVLQAGVVPNLKEDPRAAVVVFSEWQDATFRSVLKEEVVKALSRFGEQKAVVDSTTPLDEFLVQCRRGPRMSLFFLFDQFEEYFLYHPIDPGPDGFEAEFARAVNRRDVGANFLIALREDALSKLDRFQGRIPNLLANRLRLDHLQPSDAKNAIRKPLDEYNRRRPSGRRQVTIEDALVDEVVKQVETGQVVLGEEGQGQRVVEQVKTGRGVLGDEGQGQIDTRLSDPGVQSGVEAPFLQMVMTRLWDEATAPGVAPPGEAISLGVDLLRRLGGAKEIVRTHLDTVMESELDSEGRDIAARLFRYLVTPAGSKIAHTAGDLCSYTVQPLGRVEAVLTRLEKARILRSLSSLPERREPPRFEISHDVMASAVLGWVRRRSEDLERERRRRLAAAERQRDQDVETAAGRRIGRGQRFVLAAGLLVLLLALITSWQAWRLYGARQVAEATARTSTSRQLAFMSVAERSRRLDLSLLLAVAALQTDNTFEARDSLYQALQERPGLLSFLHVQQGRASSVAFSPDGRTIAAGYEDGGRGGLVLWDESKRVRLTKSPLAVTEGYVTSVAFSRDGTTVAAGFSGQGGAGMVLWDARTARRLLEAPLGVQGAGVAGVAFSPDGATVAAAYSDGQTVSGVVLWDVTRRARRAALPLDVTTGAATSVAFSPDGRTIAAGYRASDRRGGVVIWDGPEHERSVAQPLVVESGGVTSVAFSPDGRTIAAGDLSGSVMLWDAAERKPLDATPLNAEGEVSSLAFSSDGQTIAAGFGVGGRGGVALWKLTAGTPPLIVAPLAVTEGRVRGVAFKPGGTTVAAAYDGDPGTGVVIWDMARRPRLATEPLVATGGAVTSVACSPDGTTVAAGGDDGVVLWNVAKRDRFVDTPLAVSEGRVRDVAFSPDGRTVAAAFDIDGGGGGGVVLWDVASRRRLTKATLAAGSGRVNAAAYSPDGRTIAAGYEDVDERGKDERPRLFGGVVLWDVTRGVRLAADLRLAETVGAVTSVAFSSDGTTLAAGTYRGVVLWNAAERKRVVDTPLAAPEGLVRDVAFSRDGRTIAAGLGFDRGRGGGVVLWDVAARKRLLETPLPVAEGGVHSVAFSPDGTTIAAGYGAAGVVEPNSGVVLWDADARKRLFGAPLAEELVVVNSLAFSPDGETIAAAYVRQDPHSSGVMLWNVSLPSWKRLAGRLANRNFTPDEWRQFFPAEPYRPIFAELPVPVEDTGRR
jgi:WD40 repeat protein